MTMAKKAPKTTAVKETVKENRKRSNSKVSKGNCKGAAATVKAVGSRSKGSC